jgi:hypothetical protein
VYAVEATYMATHARKLIKANGLENVIEVIQSTVEDIELPEKVKPRALTFRPNPLQIEPLHPKLLTPHPPS